MANHRALWSFFLVFAIINVISLCAESDVNSIITDNGPLLRHLAEANGEDQNLEGRQSNRNKWKNTCCSECPRDNNDCSKSCKKKIVRTAAIHVNTMQTKFTSHIAKKDVIHHKALKLMFHNHVKIAV